MTLKNKIRLHWRRLIGRPSPSLELMYGWHKLDIGNGLAALIRDTRFNMLPLLAEHDCKLCHG